jgi:outer membrane immunogenic protein
MKTISRLVMLLFLGAFAQNLKAQNFQGFYVGGHLGGAFGHSDVTTTVAIDNSVPGFGYMFPADIPAIAAAGDKSLSPSGLSAGGQVGYNARLSNIVLGIEVDYGAMRLEDEVAVTDNYPDPGFEQFTFTVFQRMRTRWLFTARPRIGYAAGRLLVFGTGGLALTDIDYVGVFTDDFRARENGTISPNKSGWVAGGGAEYLISRFSIKAEYLHAKFGDMTVVSRNLTVGTSGVPENPFTHSANFSTNIVRGGVNFYF